MVLTRTRTPRARVLVVATAVCLCLGGARALVSDAVSRHATSIRARHYAAPTSPALASARALARVRLDDLTGSSPRADEARATLRAALRADTVALVELPEAGSAVSDLAELWATASRFFELNDEARGAFGPPKVGLGLALSIRQPSPWSLSHGRVHRPLHRHETPLAKKAHHGWCPTATGHPPPRKTSPEAWS